LLLAAGTDSAALPHDEEGPCAGHRGILFAFYFFICFINLFLVFGDLVFYFLFSNSLFNYLSQESAIVVTDTDPVMSSEALGGLPRAQTTRQGSRARGRPGQQEEIRSKRKGNSQNGSIIVKSLAGEGTELRRGIPLWR
jgi:hypothetical protein